MINIDIRCVDDELRNIILNKKKYNNKIILYALACIELIEIIKIEKKIPKKIIKYLNILKDYINCYIDFDFLNHLSKNKITVIIENNDINNIINSDSSNSLDFNEKLDIMITDDTNMVIELSEGNGKLINYDYYDQDIDPMTKIQAKKLFNLLDKNKDGVISALDAIYINELALHHPLIFNQQFDELIINLLTSGKNNKIDFNLFLDYFI